MNLTEILKDYPKGTKLYSPIFGDVYLDKIRPYLAVIVTTNKEQDGFKEEFLYDGRYGISGECMLFPSKDQRDWSKWQRPFVDGDIVYGNNNCCSYISIYQSDRKNNSFNYYTSLTTYGGFKINDYADKSNLRLATEEEKKKLFDDIKSHGYKWNAEEKKLEKLEDNEDKGNISDGYHTFNELYEYRLLYNASMFNELAKQGLYDVHKSKKHSDGTIPFGDENWFIVQAELPTGQISNHYEMKDWDLFKIPEKEKANPYDGHTPKDVAKRLRNFLTLEKTIVPKFKVGDTIRAKDGLQIYNVTNVTPEHYSVRAQYHACVGLLSVMDQDNWILLPNKFNPKTLQPFDKVLVRHDDTDNWSVDFCSYYKEIGDYTVCTGDISYDYCIPYNNDTKYLVGKSEEAPEFYKYWEN